MSEYNESERGIESEEAFAERVYKETGVKLEDMAEGTQGDLIGSHIFCKRGDVWIVATGYPTYQDEETGQEFWEDPKCFRKVTLK